jgi:hypothetical protein
MHTRVAVRQSGREPRGQQFYRCPSGSPHGPEGIVHGQRMAIVAQQDLRTTDRKHQDKARTERWRAFFIEQWFDVGTVFEDRCNSLTQLPAVFN